MQKSMDEYNRQNVVKRTLTFTLFSVHCKQPRLSVLCGHLIRLLSMPATASFS